MIRHIHISDQDLRSMIACGDIGLGGNFRLKIYGKLSCTSGKKMLRENRVFFHDETEALANGYRPCGHCMRVEFRAWKIARSGE